MATPPSRMLARGPAGCGKTRAALLECAAFLDRKSSTLRDDQRILLLSYTRSAVARLNETIPQLLPAEHRARVVVNTFAGFKWELLNRHGRYLGIGRSPTLVSAFAHVDGTPAQHGEVGFDDFDPLVLRLLASSKSLTDAYRSRYPMIVIDELQDTTTADWDLVRMLSESAVLRCYGDPNQAVGMTTLQAARDRMQAAIDFGCVVSEMEGGSQRDRTPGRVLSALAEAIRDDAGVSSAATNAVAAKALATRRYSYVSELPFRTKLLVRAIRSAHPSWYIGILVLAKRNLDAVSKGLLTPTPKAPFQLSHRVVGRQDVCLAVDPLLLAAWSRLCGRPVQDGELVRLCGLAVAAVQDQEALEGTARELVESAKNGTMHKGKARRLLDRLPLGTAGMDLEKFDGVATAVKTLDLSSFENFAIPRIDVLRRRLMHRQARESCVIDDLIDAGRELSAEEAILGKTTSPAHVQLMTIDSCKGREFDALVIVNHRYDTFLRRDDAPAYKAARAKLYTAITRARHGVAVVAPNDKPCDLLKPLLSSGA